MRFERLLTKENEEISKEWAQAGTDVLLHAVWNTAIIQ